MSLPCSSESSCKILSTRSCIAPTNNQITNKFEKIIDKKISKHKGVLVLAIDYNLQAYMAEHARINRPHDDIPGDLSVRL